MYTGMRIESAEALRIGLVDRVVPDAELLDAARALAADTAVVTRTAPKKADKRIDVRAFCTHISRGPDGLVADIDLTEAGTARPEEVATAVAATIGATPTIIRLVRTDIVLREAPVGAHT